MRISCWLLVVVLGVPGGVFGQELPTISARDLNQIVVKGDLGIPLGTPVEVDAEVVSGATLGGKGNDGIYFLQVNRVGGNRLDNPPLMQFSLRGRSSAALANDHFALAELKLGTRARSLNESQIADLEKGYVGKHVRLVVYEVGRFHGIPRNLPADVRVWADRGFHFSTSLVVVAEREVAAKQDFSKR